MPMTTDTYRLSSFIHMTFYLKSGINDHIWFLFALTSIYILFPIIKLAFDCDNHRYLTWLLFIFIFFSFGNFFLNWCLHTIQYLYGIRYDSIPTLVMTCAVFLLLYKAWNACGWRSDGLISSLGANTLGIYVIHYPIIQLLRPYFHDLAISNLVIVNIGYAVAIVLLSWLLTLGVRRVALVGRLFYV
jgi:surface polysaccharide O-acyltransferase-like enzyme